METLLIQVKGTPPELRILSAHCISLLCKIELGSFEFYDLHWMDDSGCLVFSFSFSLLDSVEIFVRVLSFWLLRFWTTDGFCCSHVEIER